MVEELTLTETQHELCVLDRTGDTKIIWDSTKKDEVATARKSFDDLKKKGYMAYSVKKNGEKGELLHEFDEEAEKIILAPRMVGG
jgi:hypothetical protein